MLHPLAGHWSIQLPDDGVGEPDEDGNLVVTCGLGTIVVSVFEAHPGFEPETALEGLKASDRPAPRAEFDEYGPDGTVRWAFLLDEDVDEVGHEAGFYGYVIAEEGWTQVAVLYQDRKLHDQAVAIWRSIRRGAT